MQLDHAIRHRRAVRAFTGKPPAPAVIERLIDAAVHAPSAVNKQPWLFTVVRDNALLDRISAEAKKHIVSLIQTGSGPEDFRELMNDPDFHIFYHAPALIVISTLKEDAWAKEDAALAAENLMLAAFAEGLGTCWIGFAQRWLETDEGKHAIDVPGYYQPVAPIILGHPKGDAPVVPRNPPVIRWID
jgi:nitroreductase